MTKQRLFHIPAIALMPALILVFFLLLYVTLSGIIKTQDLSLFWNGCYIAGGIYIIQRVRRGYLYEPMVLVGGSYLFALVVGELLFSFFKDRTYSFLGSNYTGLGFSALLLGAYITHKYDFVFSRADNHSFKFRPMNNVRLVWWLVIICILATIALFGRSGTIPILSANPAQAKMAFFSGNGMFSIFLKGIPFICIALLYDALVRPGKNKMLRLNLLTAFYIFVTILVGFRSSIVVFAIQYISVYFMFNRRPIPLWLIVFSIVGLLVFVSFIGAFRRGGLTAADFTREVGITLVARPVAFELILKYYDESRFSYGARYWEDLKKLLPGAQTGANVDLKFEIFKGFVDMPDTAGITPSIIGEAYINFGHYGIMGICLLCGLLMSYVYTQTRRKPSFFNVSFLTHLSLSLVISVISGIGTILVSFLIGFFWILVLSVLYERKIQF